MMAGQSGDQDGKIDYYKVNDSHSAYHEYNWKQCKAQLMMDFPWIYTQDIMKVQTFHWNRYALCHRSLSRVMEELDRVDPLPDKDARTRQRIAPQQVAILLTGNTNVYVNRTKTDERRKRRLTFHRMTQKRGLEITTRQRHLLEEMKFVREYQSKSKEPATEETQDSSSLDSDSVECACCYGNVAFETTAQCYEGHLVCVECLNMYTKEKAFGCSKLDLDCMETGCSSSYPKSELERCLPAEIITKWEECLMESSLKSANISDLGRCPSCNYAAINSPRSKVFVCQREGCNKMTCRSCEADWADHQGKTCAEMEKRDEMALRKKFEESMTKSKVRTCRKCQTEFLKESGCNKMTCRCGEKMCYICRKSNIGYDHFCRHVRDPGFACKVCTECSLWTTTEADDELAIKELKREAQEKRKELGYDDDKLIGAPTEKRARLFFDNPLPQQADNPLPQQAV